MYLSLYTYIYIYIYIHELTLVHLDRRLAIQEEAAKPCSNTNNINIFNTIAITNDQT